MMKLLKKVTKLSKSEKYLLTCSYGPDSMALFFYLLENNFDFEIAHVNYHILAQADDDEKGIREFANKYGIKIHVLSTYMPENVNEEIWARNVRYTYFEELAKKLGIKNVLVAHNEGDLIETYLLQKVRGGVFFKYGLSEVSERGYIKIIRPLLKIKKDDLEKYCIDNNVPYSIDPSNFDSKFKRNAIRKELKLKSDTEIEQILNEINEKNLQNLLIIKKYKKLGLPNKLYINKDLLKEITVEEFQLLLIYMLLNKGIYTSFSKGRVKNLLEVIYNSKLNHREKIDDNYYLSIDYGELKIVKKGTRYEYCLNDKEDGNSLFKINSDSEDFELVKDNFPIKIKPALEGVKYRKNGKTFKVNREFISWKLPWYLREIWPGIYTKNDELIYVPRYQIKVKKNGLLLFNPDRLL